MVIDVVLNPAEIALLRGVDLGATTCVVFDVLRATSSMITALENGASAIYPVRTVEEAFELKQRMPDAILAGERHGERIEGFDLGNSPFEYQQGVAGRRIITTTTNGTIALRACEEAQCVLVGALLNLGALREAIETRQPERLLVICAGTFEHFALEDAAAAGFLIASLGGADLTDSARAALAITRFYPDPQEALMEAANGRVLCSKGRQAEVSWCAQISRLATVGVLTGGALTSLGR